LCLKVRCGVPQRPGSSTVLVVLWLYDGGIIHLADLPERMRVRRGRWRVGRRVQSSCCPNPPRRTGRVGPWIVDEDRRSAVAVEGA
jgi:hypothetical protein